MTRRAFFLLTQHHELGTTGLATGVWADELTTPYYALLDHGFAPTLATLNGGAAQFEPRSVNRAGENGGSVDRFLVDMQANRALNSTRPLEDFEPANFDVLVVPGGHGALWDLGRDDRAGRFVGKALTTGCVVAAACHGPAALLTGRSPNTAPVIRGRKVACFTAAEEEMIGLDAAVPYSLEHLLRELGADVATLGPFQPCAVRDANLITCQNPQSTSQLVQLILQALGIS